MRINKYLASCGLASRRACEQFVLEGKVKVNGEVIASLAFDVDERNDVVECAGKLCNLKEENVYIMLHKPKGFLCTKNDGKKDRKTIYDLISGYEKFRLFSVGRLDMDTEGLILLTNDGDLANKLTHPKGEVEKTYIAKIEGEILPENLSKLRNGVTLDDGFKTAKAKVNFVSKEKNVSKIEISIHEGKNRQVRRMFQAVGKEVIFLKRTGFAGLKLGGLGRGMFRKLKDSEVALLKKKAGL